MAYAWDIVDKFQPELELLAQRHIECTVFSAEDFGDMYQSLRRGVPYDHDDPRERYGILSAKFRKQG